MIRTLLIANRGEIACRILATCHRLGIRAVVVYSEADAGSLAVRTADEAICIGPAPAAESYLNIDSVLNAARLCGADAVHPGYGFLAENAEFARRVVEAGLVFVGPKPEVIAQMGSKVAARALCQQIEVPVIPGSGATDDAGLLSWAEQHGYPVMLKASAGGGGKGMRRLTDTQALSAALSSTRREAEKAFGSDALYLERALDRPRHLEVQIISDHFGHHLHLGVRDCSLQRRHQKIIEECPPTGVSSEILSCLTAAALKLANVVGYTSVGTVEFLVTETEYFFLEMNTRLQVEHPVTEAVTGLDLVELQLLIAEDTRLPFRQDQVIIRGHAVEARIACEDPGTGFLPATGAVLVWEPAFRARVDTGIDRGSVAGPHYDSMVAKIICWGDDRGAALRRLDWSLANTVFLGVRNNIDFLRALLRDPIVQTGDLNTEFVEAWSYSTPTVSRRQLLAAAAARQFVEADGRGEAPALAAFPVCLEFVGQPAVRIINGLYTVEQEQYQVEYRPGTLVVDGHRFPVTVAEYDNTWWIHTPEGTVDLVACPRHPVPQSSTAAGHSLKAPMPGKLVEVLVQVGDSVSADQPLLKLEAMKMEHIICAPNDGVVESLPFALGDQVKAGAELVGLSATLTEPKDL